MQRWKHCLEGVQLPPDLRLLPVHSYVREKHTSNMLEPLYGWVPLLEHLSSHLTGIFPFTLKSEVLFFFFLLRAAPVAHGGSQARSYSCRPTPQPQQGQIQVVSETYITAHGNARSLTHRARPGIEPEISHFLVRFVSAAPQQELQI